MGIFSDTRATISPAIMYFILDVEKILEKREDKTHALSDRDKAVLNQAIDFLETAEKGQRILQTTTGTLVADMVSIKHYNYVSKAWPVAYPREIEQILRTSKEVFQAIVNNSRPNKKDLSETKQLFETLSDLSFSQLTLLQQTQV